MNSAMAPKLCAPKRGSKNLRKRTACETQLDKTALSERKRSRLSIASGNEKEKPGRLENMETQQASVAGENQKSDGSNQQEASRQSPDRESIDNTTNVESKIILSVGKSSTRTKSNAPKNVKSEESSPQQSEVEKNVTGTGEATVKAASDKRETSSEEFEDILKSFVFKILDVAPKTPSASCEASLSKIRKETCSLLRSHYENGLERTKDIFTGTGVEAELIVNAKTYDVIGEHTANKKEKNYKSEILSSTPQAGRGIVTVEPSNTEMFTPESKVDLRMRRKEDDDGSSCVKDEENIQSEEKRISCATNATKCAIQEVPTISTSKGECLMYQSEKDQPPRRNTGVLLEQQATSLDEPDATACKTSSGQNNTTTLHVDEQENASKASKKRDQLTQHEGIISGDAKTFSASGQNTQSSQGNSNEDDVPSCADLLDFTNSQLVQIEEAEKEMIQREASGPSSKGEDTIQSIHRMQDEDIDNIASRRLEEERRDDKRVKEIMQKMMKDLNEIKVVTGSLLTQMSQYRKHRSQRQLPQQSRLTGTHVTTSGFRCKLQGKGSRSSQFKKS